MRGGYPLNADHILGVLYFHGRKRFRCLVMLDAFLLKGSFDGDGGVARGRDETETGMEQGMWVYMAAAVGAG